MLGEKNEIGGEESSDNFSEGGIIIHLGVNNFNMILGK